MRRLSATLLLLPMLVVALVAQGPRVSADLTTTTCPGTACVSIGIAGLRTVAIQVTGTWTGTITFEGSIDGVTFSTVNMLPITGTQTAVTTTTANGIWSSSSVGGLVIFRARMSSFSAGPATVTLSAAVGSPVL